MGASDSGNDQGGRGCLDIGADILGGGTIGPAIRVRDMGPDTVYTYGAGRIPPQGGPQTDGWEPRKGRGGGCVYLPLEDAMEESGLQEVETYIFCRQNTVAKYIVTMPLMDLCIEAKRIPGPIVAMRWW